MAGPAVADEEVVIIDEEDWPYLGCISDSIVGIQVRPRVFPQLDISALDIRLVPCLSTTPRVRPQYDARTRRRSWLSWSGNKATSTDRWTVRTAVILVVSEHAGDRRAGARRRATLPPAGPRQQPRRACTGWSSWLGGGGAPRQPRGAGEVAALWHPPADSGSPQPCWRL